MAQPVNAVLARKLSVGQEGQGDGPRSALRAFRLGFARAAGDRLNLPLSVIGAKQSERSPDVLGDFAGDDWLLLRFSDPDGVAAAVCMDIGVVSAILQVQTIGEVMPDPPAGRSFTDTDAAMVAPMVEEALRRADALADPTGGQPGLTGYEFKARLADMRSLSLAMVEDAYLTFDLTVELSGGLRQGHIALLLPERAGTDAEIVPEDPSGPSLEQATGVVRAELNTVICRMNLPLAALSGLSAGDVLPLTGSRLDRAEVLTIDRTRAAVGRLGQCGGMRAVRLNEYAPLPALANTEEFLEARLATEQPHHAETARQEGQPSIKEPDLTAETLEFNDSDQIAAEISKLAGLENNPDAFG
ncbi:flagellar motor switch protein FliM [Ruegeria lacuscaerulensis]|uniref:flagellar motor switch protein FliM n=1 Tax=Ruegeria lacuscaerulensis TaxID=55218 RepID=UPI00148196F8|nr:flagellar motor switch protein FliM [Ruegeria lacuscaerulensis]